MLWRSSRSHPDPTLLKQVYHNLLSNALKFTRKREQAVIEIGSEVQGGERIWFVKDNGVGFRSKYADKLFGVFQRLHSGEEYEGTGVGLAIVDRVVTRHGGRVWAVSEEDKGAEFTLRWASDLSDLQKYCSPKNRSWDFHSACICRESLSLGLTTTVTKWVSEVAWASRPCCTGGTPVPLRNCRF